MRDISCEAFATGLENVTLPKVVSNNTADCSHYSPMFLNSSILWQSYQSHKTSCFPEVGCNAKRWSVREIRN